MEKAFLNIVKGALFFSLITPLVIGPFGITFSSYPKAVFFRTIIEAAFIFYILLVLVNKKYLPKINPVMIAICAYLLVSIISSILGVNFFRSLFGDLDRSEGLILAIHFFVFYVMLISVFEKEWINILKTTAIVGAISSISALLQKTGAFTFYGVNLPERVSGTLTNPDFFGNYIVLCFFVSLIILVIEKKPVWLIVSFLNILALVLSATRGSWVALLLGLCVLLGQFFSLSYKIRIKALFSIFGFCVLLLLIVLNFNIYKSPYFWHAYSITEFSLESRADIWQPGFEAFIKRPILGWGFEMFNYYYEKNFNAKLLTSLGEELYYDRSHNKFLDILAETGFVGFFAFISIFFAAVFKVEKKLRWFFIAAFIAYFFQSLFYFDTISSYLIIYTLLAYSSRRKEFGPDFHQNKPIPYVVAFVLIFLALITFFSVNFRPFLASIKYPSVVKFEKTDPNKAEKGYISATKFNTVFDREFRLVSTQRIVLMVEKGNLNAQNLQKFLPELEKDIAKPDRRMNDSFENLTRVYENVYIFTRDKIYLEKMRNTLNRALVFNGQAPRFYLLLAEMELLNGNYSEGEKNYKIMSSMFEKSPENDALTFQKIGAGYLKCNVLSKAAENFDKTLMLDSNLRISTGRAVLSDPLVLGIKTAQIFCRDLKDLNKCNTVISRLLKTYPEYKKTINEMVLKYVK